MDEGPLSPVADALARLAESNRDFMRRDPDAYARYWARLGGEGGGFRYAFDHQTCGRPGCWSTWEAMDAAALSGEDGPILLDCEDDAAALAGAIAVRDGVALVGIVPGVRISHAIAGRFNPAGEIEILDPTMWHEMPGKIDYTRPILWRVVKGA